MGAVVNLRPGPVPAAVLAVPFVDVMNTMMDASLPLTVGEYLEWGNPNEKAALRLHEDVQPVRQPGGEGYPAMLVTTGFNDSQVMYWEPAKYVAKLRTLKTDTNPLLLKTTWPPATAARRAATTRSKRPRSCMRSCCGSWGYRSNSFPVWP